MAPFPYSKLFLSLFWDFPKLLFCFWKQQFLSISHSNLMGLCIWLNYMFCTTSAYAIYCCITKQNKKNPRDFKQHFYFYFFYTSAIWMGLSWVVLSSYLVSSGSGVSDASAGMAGVRKWLGISPHVASAQACLGAPYSMMASEWSDFSCGGWFSREKKQVLPVP